MITGMSGELAVAGIFIILAGVLILRRSVGLLPALLLAVLKAAIFMVYFAYFDTGEFRMKDDKVYHEGSVRMYEAGWNPLRMMTEAEASRMIHAEVGSGHFFYYWWTILAFELFGKNYWAPIAFNVSLTFVSSLLLMQFVLMAGGSLRYARALAIFYTLHWDILTWSSFVSLKDMIVIFLTLLTMWCAARMYYRFRMRYVLMICGVFFVLTMLRFYLPFLLSLGIGAWVFVIWRDPRRVLIIPLGLAAAVLLRPWESEHFALFQVQNPLYPMLRFFLMPQFWTLQVDEQYLFPSALLHWIFFAPLLFGVSQIWRFGNLAKLPIVYAICLIVFYAMVPELQGYRHRVQISWVIAWAQLHAVWVFLQAGAARERAPRELGG